MKKILFILLLVSFASSAYAGPYDGIWAIDNSPVPAYFSVQQDDFGTVVALLISFFTNGDPSWAFGIGDLSGNIADITVYGGMDFRFFPAGGFATINFAGRRASFTTTGLQDFFLLTSGTMRKIFP